MDKYLISYLDQEGRTIATALSGQSPSNVSVLNDISGNALYSPPASTNVIHADLLNKISSGDADTELDNNNRVGNELSFSTRITVPTATTYTISYDLQGTSFTYTCLPGGVCLRLRI